MAILGCNFDINFGQTLALGSSLSNTLGTKLHAWTESSILLSPWSYSFGSTIYRWIFMAPLKCVPGGWILGAWRAENEPSPFSWKSKTKSQRSNPKWLLQYLTTPTFCAKLQPNRLTTTFGFRKTFSDSDTSMSYLYIYPIYPRQYL